MRNFDDYLDKATRLEIEQDLQQRLATRYNAPNVLISAATGENIEQLRQDLVMKVRELWQQQFQHRRPMWADMEQE